VNLNSVGILLLVIISARRTAWSPVSDVGGEMMGLITVSFSALLKLQDLGRTVHKHAPSLIILGH
jgi:hypothetical protein